MVSQVDSTQTTMIADAQALLEKLNAENTSCRDIIDPTELRGLTLTNCDARYEQYGVRLIRFVKFNMRFQTARWACDKASELLQGRLSYPTTASAIAVTKFGVGECGELTNLALVSLNSHQRHQVVLTNDKQASRVGNGLEMQCDANDIQCHAFNLLGLTPKQWATFGYGCRTVDELLESLSKCGVPGIIFDPLFKVVSPFSQYKEQAKPLLRYIDTFNTRYLGAVNYTAANTPLVDRALKEAETIYQKAQTLLESNPGMRAVEKRDEVSSDLIAKKLLSEVLLPGVQSALREYHPSLSWDKTKIDLTNCSWTVWAKGSVEILQPIGDHLKKIGMRVSAEKVKKEETSYAIIFKDSDPVELRVRFIFFRTFSRGVVGLILDYAK